MKIHYRTEFLVVFSLFMLAASPATALEWKGGVDLMFGKKELDSDWKPVDSLREVGVMVSFTEADLPFGITAGYITGDDKNNSVDYHDDTPLNIELKGKTEEFLLGIRKDFSPAGSDNFKAYINGGYTGIKWNIETRYNKAGATGYTETDDWAHGFWLGGGMYIVFAQNAAIGIDYKYTDASSDIDSAIGDTSKEAGGSHYSAFIGWRF